MILSEGRECIQLNPASGQCALDRTDTFKKMGSATSELNVSNIKAKYLHMISHFRTSFHF